MGTDRLSALPDSLVISILSLLSTREAMRTCVLSRRWRFIWTDLSVLAFKGLGYRGEKLSKFVDCVHKYISICGGEYLRRFEVSFHYNKSFASDVYAWIQFVLKHKVKDVALLLDVWPIYLLPQMMYSDSHLTCLRLEGFIMAPKKVVEWGALSSLYLENVEFGKNAIKRILSGCPLLYDLTLVFCWYSSKLDCLDFKSQSLRELSIIGIGDMDDDREKLIISAPSIHYARISVDIKRSKFELKNISSLIEADIDFQCEDNELDNVSKLMGYTKRLFKQLHHVKKLKAGPEFIEALGDLVVEEGMQLSQFGVECLLLNARIYHGDHVHGIACLLESSPNIKKLLISLWCSTGYIAVGLDEVELNRDLLHLKTITIMVTENPELVVKPMLTLVRLLLKRAPVLEKLVIDFSIPSLAYFRYPPLEYIKIAQTLASYPRASAQAVVELAQASSSAASGRKKQSTNPRSEENTHSSSNNEPTPCFVAAASPSSSRTPAAPATATTPAKTSQVAPAMAKPTARIEPAAATTPAQTFQVAPAMARPTARMLRPWQDLLHVSNQLLQPLQHGLLKLLRPWQDLLHVSNQLL